jgi:hypothetical protein
MSVVLCRRGGTLSLILILYLKVMKFSLVVSVFFIVRIVGPTPAIQYWDLQCPGAIALRSLREKKAGVVEHPEVIDHVGLLVNGPPGTAELPFI